jgi:hypothetical protein
VASAQDGGLGSALLELAEQAPGGRAGSVREACAAAPPGVRAGEPNCGGAPGAGSLSERRADSRRPPVL